MTTERGAALTKEFTDQEVLQYVLKGADAWRPRWNVVKTWRDIRYGRDNIRSLIPDALRATNYEHHDFTFNKACFELASFLSAAEPVFEVAPPSNGTREKAQNLQTLLAAILGPGGKLDVESGNQVAFKVWQNQGENGHGIYKLVMKASYPLSMPQRLYADDGVGYEPNPGYKPSSRKDGRDARGETRLRETDAALKARRDEYASSEFPFQWMDVDSRVFFEFKQGGVPIMQGEITQRPATLLNEHGLSDLNVKGSQYVFLGEPSPKDSSLASYGQQRMVNFFELWTPTWGYCGFMSATALTDGNFKTVFSKGDDWRWVNPFNRLPYFQAFGLPSTEDDIAGALHGSFDSLIADTSLLNYYETLIFNQAHREMLPLYQPVVDASFGGGQVPLNAEQQQMVTSDKIEEVDLPPGWKWEPVNPGAEVDVQKQLDSVRQRIKENALRAVLTGETSGAASGAQVSLMLGAASRAMSPLVRNHEIPVAEMGSAILETCKRLMMTLSVEHVVSDGTGTDTIEVLEVKPSDIVTTRVRVKYAIELPVDAAALETRGMALLQGGHKSYESVAPEYFGVDDPQKEKIRIRMDRFSGPMDNVAFQSAVQQLAAYAPEVFKEIMGQITPPPPAEATVGGGAAGAYGGAAAQQGQGGPALPGATTMPGAGGAPAIALHASGS